MVEIIETTEEASSKKNNMKQQHPLLSSQQQQQQLINNATKQISDTTTINNRHNLLISLSIHFDFFQKLLSLSLRMETILDKENFTLEELFNEEEIIQECKARNDRLINLERTHVEQLVRYIVEEPPEDAEDARIFKFPFFACEIFTCEVDIILKALVEDEELMNLLFSFLEPEYPRSALLAGYFSEVVKSLLLQKTVPFMNYIRAHQDILKKLVDLIGITSIMVVLIRLICADEHLYTSYVDSMKWLEDTDMLEMIVDKFSSTDCPKVHANAAEVLCAITRYAAPGLAAKVFSPSFIARLFRHALEYSRPKSVLVHSLYVCISLLDPKRQASGTYYIYNQQSIRGSVVTGKPETVEVMLESLGNLLKLWDVSAEGNFLSTTYGKLQPPLGKNRLKIVEFISALMTVSSKTVEKELIHLGALKRILELFFEYPYNNFMHHHVEQIMDSCLESKNLSLIQHILEDCQLVKKILDAEKNDALVADPENPTVPAEGRTPSRKGNVGHMTRISNKLIEEGANNSYIQSFLQGDSEWVDWHTNVLTKRNAINDVIQWECGRPTRVGDNDDYQNRDDDMEAVPKSTGDLLKLVMMTITNIEMMTWKLYQTFASCPNMDLLDAEDAIGLLDVKDAIGNEKEVRVSPPVKVVALRM